MAPSSLLLPRSLALVLDRDHELVGLVDQVGRRGEHRIWPERASNFALVRAIKLTEDNNLDALRASDPLWSCKNYCFSISLISQ